MDRALVLAFSIAFLLHLPFLPLASMERLFSLFFGHMGDYDDADAGAVIPIDLDLEGTEPNPDPPKPPPPHPPAKPPPPPPPPPVKLPPPPKPVPTEVPDAGAPEPPKRLPSLGDPMQLAGAAGRIAAKDPNVQLLLNGKVLRRHELGPWFSKMLREIPEWKAFFEGSPLDPIHDLDHILITAPQLKKDSSKLVAVMELGVPPEAAREAIGQVLQRTKGVWLEDAPVTAARAVVGGAPRIFALLPERRLLVVLPEEAKDQLSRLKQARGFRNSSVAAVVSLVTPWRPFEEILPLPHSLRWLRLGFTPAADGGVDLAIEAGDASPAEAKKDAEVLSGEIEARRKVSVLGMSFEIGDEVQLAADKEVIRGRTHVNPTQMRAVTGWLEEKARERYRQK